VADKPRRCPPWCSGDHHYGSMHISATPFVGPGLGFRAAVHQHPGSRKYVGVSGVKVKDALDADALARLLVRLADATPEQHRELSEQVRAAGVIAFGEAMKELNGD
jgi:hypothetical protein